MQQRRNKIFAIIKEIAAVTNYQESKDKKKVEKIQVRAFTADGGNALIASATTETQQGPQKKKKKGKKLNTYQH